MTPDRLRRLHDLRDRVNDEIRTAEAQATTVTAVRAVVAATGVPASHILGRRRTHEISDARAVACWVLRDTTALSYPAIGRLFGRHHTTVMYAVSKVEREPELLALARKIAAAERRNRAREKKGKSA